MTEDRIKKIERTLEEQGDTLKEHGTAIYELQESTNRLEAGQERQAVAIQELSAGFGQVLGELGKVGDDFRRGKQEMLAAIGNVSDHVVRLDSNQKSFRAEWKGICEERHKLVDFRLVRVEKDSRRSLEEIDEMSEQSKVQYIQDLQGQLEAYASQQIAQAKEEREDKRMSKKGKMTLIGIIVGGLLTGTGGTVLIQWILERF